MPPWIDWSKV